MNFDAYLDRIKYKGSLEPTLETLAALQMAHLQTIPFENLSVVYKQPIVLDLELLFEKVIGRNRGGFCYELNGLFASLLRHLGFQVSMLEARVFGADGVAGKPFDHLTLQVDLDQPYLVDVGFGDSFRVPLRLNTTGEQQCNQRSYRLTGDAAMRTLMERKPGGEWAAQYEFPEQFHTFSDYKEMCVYQQTSPDSTFTQRRICTLATPNGRITLTAYKIVTTSLTGEKHDEPIADEAAFRAALRKHFNIVEI